MLDSSPAHMSWAPGSVCALVFPPSIRGKKKKSKLCFSTPLFLPFSTSLFLPFSTPLPPSCQLQAANAIFRNPVAAKETKSCHSGVFIKKLTFY